MTCIAWDGNTLAADRRSTGGNGIVTVTKIRRINGSLVGCSGSATSALEMMAWLERGAKPDEFPTTQRDVDLYAGTLVIEPDGRLLKYERGPYPMNFLDTQTAIGSGGDFARAAMACGRTAAQAVEMAALFDSGTGNGIDTLALE